MEGDHTATELEGDQSWTLWKQLVEHTDTLLALVDEDGKILAASDKLASLGDMLGSSHRRLFHPDSQPTGDRALRRAIAEGAAEEEILDLSGQRWWRIKVIPLVSDGPRRFIYLLEDVTEKRGKVSSGSNQGYFQLIFESSADPIFIHKLDGTVLDVNPAACELLGKDKEELVGSKAMDFGPKKLHPDPKNLDELMRTGRTRMETEGVDGQGRIISLELNVHTMAFEDGPVMVTTARDIGPRKEAEELLRSYATKLRTLYDQVGVAIAQVRRDGTIIDVNGRFSSLTGHPKDKVIDRPFWDLLEPSTVASAQGDIRQLNEKHEPLRTSELRVVKDDGSVGWVRATTSVIWEGQDPVFVIILEDIDRHKRNEESLRLSQANYKAIVNDQTELICRFTPGGALTFANEAYCKYFRARSEELVGHIFLEGISEADRADIMEMIGALTPEAPSVTYDHVYCPSFRPGMWLQWTDRAMFGPDGLIVEIQSVGRDITDRLLAKNAVIESEERLRTIVESTSDMVWEVDQRSIITYISGRVRDILGYEPADLLGRSLFELMSFEQGERTMTLMAGIMRDQQPVTDLELEIVREDGGSVVLLWHLFPIVGGEGELIGYRGVSKDITEKKRTEDALRRSEERFRSLVHNSLDVIAVMSPEGKILYISPSSLRLLGYPPDQELTRRTIIDLLHPDDLRSVERALDQLIQYPQTTVSTEFRLRHSDGRWVYFEGVGSNLLSEPAVNGLVINARDITERKRAEEILRRRDEILEAISLVSERLIRGASWADNIADVLEVMGEATGIDRVHVFEMLENNNGSKHVYLRYEWTSPGTSGIRSKSDLDGFDLRKVGLSRWEDTLLIGGIVQACVSDLSYPGRSFLEVQNIRSTIAVPILAGYELWGYISLDDVVEERRWSSTEIDAIRAVASTLGSSILRERASQDLEMEKERLAVTLRSIADGVITTDINGDVVLINNAAEEMLGFEQMDVEGQPVRRIFRMVKDEGASDENPVYRVLKHGDRVDMGTHSVIGRNQRRMTIEASAAPIRDRASKVIGAVLVFRDVTTRKAMEEELVRSQRLESVGVLAGGIAHDFNNIMTAILGNIALAKSWCGKGDRVMDKLVETEKATLRARDLTQQLLTFSKGGAPIKQAASISEVLHDTIDFSLSGSNIKAHYEIPDDIWAVSIDPGQISQVIENLITNAKDAMPRGGALDIIAKNYQLGPGDIPSMRPGCYVKISLRDYGVGIPPENFGKIFEPYFTTKSKGTGLGLAVVYSVIAKHDGHIEVESEAGRGTSFHIYLPATAEARPAKDNLREAIVYGKGRVLLMDDEEFILDVTGEVLRSLGYEVELARDGEEAIDHYKRGLVEGRRFDAVIVDLTIPGGMGGKEAVKELLKIDPGVKAIVSSGYSSDATMADFLRFGFVGVIPKPYKIEDLSRVMQEVIAADRVH